MPQLTEAEKKQLVRALFLTTGVVLSAMFYRESNFLYAVPGIGVFYLAGYLADKKILSNLPLHLATVGLWLSATGVWFVLYKIFQSVS